MKCPRRIIALVVFITIQSVCGGCSYAPSAEQLANADYGLRPSESAAQSTARSYVLARLKDPESARITFGTIDKSWFRAFGGKTRFAWGLPTAVNAKNSYGGYTGDKPWVFYFRGDQMVGVGEPNTSVSRYGVSTYLLYIETPGVDWPVPEKK